MYTIPQDLLDLLAIPDGGFTWNPRTGKTVRSGFAVSPFKDRERATWPSSVNSKHISSFVYENSDLLNQEALYYVGAWHNPADRLVYYDVTVVVPTAREAITLCRAFDQLAYYDFAAGKSVPVEQKNLAA